MLPYGVGVKPDTPWIKDVVLYVPERRLVDPVRGIVYGATGQPVGTVCADGYVRLGRRRGGYQYAHRLIYATVHGEIEPGLEIDHLNGRKDDNRIRNLDAVTRSENVKRAVANGLAPVGEQRSDAKLTDALVLEIRQTVGEITNSEWARRAGVDKATIRAVREGKSWRHVPLRARRKPAQKRGHVRRGRQ